MEQNSIKDLGQVKIKRLEIIGADGTRFDLIGQYVQLDIYEDLFADTISGSITVTDSIGMINSLPLIGQELIRITFETPSLKEVDQTFYVYKLGNRVFQTPQSQSYTLYFISKEAILDINRKLSKSYNGSVSLTVTKLFSELKTKKQINVEPTSNSYKFITPYWSPFEAIHWITPRAVAESGATNYVFYESFDAYEFVSATKLFQQKPLRTLVYSNLDPKTLFGEDKENSYAVVEEIFSDTVFDYIRRASMGMYESVLTTYDMTTKTINTNSYKYLEDFSKVEHLEKHPLAAADLISKKQSNMYFFERNDFLYSRPTAQNYNKWFLQRNSLMEQLHAFRVTVKVKGRTDIQVGKTIKLVLPTTKAFTGIDKLSDTSDSVYTGKYLITAIRHRIIDGIHEMLLELSKDSVKSELKSNE